MNGRALQDRFASPERQKEAAQLGMWIYIGTEVLLFSALFVAYGEYRSQYTQGFDAAGEHVTGWLGLVLTIVLVSSSFAASLAVDSSRKDRMARAAAWLLATILLGCGFLALHLWEWFQHIHEGAGPGAWYRFTAIATPGANIFFTLYFLMTGFHMLHVTAGLGLLGWVTSQTLLRRYDASYQTPIEIIVLYWHFVDLVWVFLFPLFYLVNR